MQRITISCFIIFALVSCFYRAESLECYDGEGISATKTGCTACKKEGASSSGFFGGLVSFDASTRTCVVNGTCVQVSGGGFGIQGGSFCCTTDLCNGSSTLYISSLLSLGIFLIQALRWL